MVRIPSEYQEVEYLESTGTQYIDTGIQARSGVKCTASIMWISGGATDACILGGRKGLSSRIMLIHQYPANKWTLGYGSSYTHLSRLDYGNIYYIESKLLAGEQLLRVNKETIYEGTDDSEYSNDCNLAMFACRYDNNAKSVSLYSKARIYSMLIKNGDDEPLANFIPCYRKSDNEIGMYDTVSKIFFTNQGTGTFLKGNDVNYDTVNLMESRRRILLNTPHFESLTGSMLSFKTDMASKLKECKIHFTPIQEGSGDPSPDNIRPIRGYDSITIYNGQTAVATIPFPQTIYGGYVDLVKGEVVEEYKDYDMGDLDWTEDTTAHLFQYTFTVMPVNENNTLMTTYCEGYHPTYNSSLGTIRRVIGNYAIMGRNLYKSLWFRDDSYSTGAEFKQSNTGKHIVVPLEIPNSYSLDPVTIRTLRGLNNIWSDANGNIEIKYWTH